MKVERKSKLSLTTKETTTPVPQTSLLISNVMKRSLESASVIARENIAQTRHLRRMDNLMYLIAISTSIIALAILVGVVYLLRGLLALLITSFLIAYILSPIITYFERRGVNRTLVVVLISLLVLSGIILTSIYLVNVGYDQIVGLKDQLAAIFQDQELGQKAKNWIIKWNETLESRIPMLKNYNLINKITEGELNIQEKIMPVIQGLFSSSTKILPSLFSTIALAVIVPFLTFFILNSGRNIKKTFVNLVPNRAFEPTLSLLDELDRQLGRYIRSRVIIETIALSILTSIGYWILGLKFFFILGIFAGVANLMPYIGPVVGAIPAVIMAFVGTPCFSLPWTIILIGIIVIAIQFIDNTIIFPLFIGKSVDLGPVSTMFAVLIGAKFLGLLGLLIAVPIAAMLKVIVSEIFKQFKGYMQTARSVR